MLGPRTTKATMRFSATAAPALRLAAQFATAAPAPAAPASARLRLSIPPSAKPTSLTSSVTLRTGFRMPVVGLGTWRAGPGEVGAAVAEALKQGYRHIDGAAVYQNEPEVGAAIRQWLASTGEKRESLFVTSKLWNVPVAHQRGLVRNHAPEDVESALRHTLKDLGLSYLDLYLIHWPVSWLHTCDESGRVLLYPKDKRTGQPLFPREDIPLEATWEALVECQRKGLVRSLGVSNCTSEQVLALGRQFGLQDGPTVNQVEIHPFCPQYAMQRALSPSVHLTAYSPLGNIHASPPSAGIKASAGEQPPPPPPSPLVHPTIVDIASAHGVTPAQVLLRWNLQLGRVVIPKSVRPARIQENASLFHFDLTDGDLDRIEQLFEPNTRVRLLNPTSFLRTPKKRFFTDFE